MSVEALELTSNDWTMWQGHVVNGAYPLGRHIGGSAYSGVFETKAETLDFGRLAIKLIPAGQGDAELALLRWTRIGELSHPHILRQLDSGTCELDGAAFLYVVMEYAEQSLAQLLPQRALSAGEARDMLPPILDALRFLHDRDLIHGGLKPANVLVIQDQLKLASDSIDLPGESTPSPGAPSVFDSPEARQGHRSVESDIWALGITLVEALTRRSPGMLAGDRHSSVLPADFPPEFRDVVARCLSHDPQDRPSVTDLLSWMAGQALKPLPERAKQPAAWEKSTPRIPEAAAPVAASSDIVADAARPVQAAARPAKTFGWMPRTVLAAVIVSLGWAGIRVFKTSDAPTAETAAVALASQPTAVPPPATTQPPAPVAAASTPHSNRSDAPKRLVLHEELPAVPSSAARTIRGHVKVSVQAVVNPDGSVSRVTAGRSGGSRFFQRLALQAAKKWTFAPEHAEPPRLVEIQFSFGRDQTTGRALLAD